MPHPLSSTSDPSVFRIGVMTMDVEGQDSEAFSALVRDGVERFKQTIPAEHRLETEIIAFNGPHLTPGAGSYSPLDFFQIAFAEKAERNIQFLLVVTEVDLTASTRAYTLALPSQLTNIAILSTKRLDPGFWGEGNNHDIAARRLSALLLHSFGKLVNLPPSSDPDNAMHPLERVEDLDRMERLDEKQWARVDRVLPREAHERRTRGARLPFILSTLLRDAPEIVRALIRANPFKLVMSLPTMVAAGLSVIIVLLFSAETWDVASAVSIGQVSLFALVSVLAALFVLYRAFALDAVMSRDRYLAETTVVTISVTLLSLAITLLLLFAGFGLLMYLGIVSVFPGKLMETWPTVDPAVRTLDHVKLSLFLASMGILAGSLGGRSDSRDLVRGVLFIDEES
ncbi:hypothetical protein [Sphingomicrobium lutaoense]|uniref:Uncharacterized protein n=1 Tax=Sphingomicrobium lutaoense TaxID=515949 RepID=A0A839YWZ4_9SPHN|nr:hypothetical protein [Sphingomicrobium lutaoense]MBB3764721.1 hypothetical protein [Sphingomicrobium lutaoense]